ncbi:MAG: hypothetical protein RL745_988 [Actinomycetota bacterium]
MWQQLASVPEQYLAVAAVSVACSAISPARFVFYAATQKKRLAWWQVCLCSCSLVIAGAVIGAICGAVLVDSASPLSSAGKAGLVAVVLDPMNIPATLRFAQVALRLLASLPLPPESNSESKTKDNDTGET